MHSSKHLGPPIFGEVDDLPQCDGFAESFSCPGFPVDSWPRENHIVERFEVMIFDIQVVVERQEGYPPLCALRLMSAPPSRSRSSTFASML